MPADLIISAQHVRTTMLGSEAGNDSQLEAMILSAQGEVERIIGQPVQARSVTDRWEGNGLQGILCQYTLKPTLTSIHYRLGVGQAFDQEISSPVILGNRYEAVEGFRYGVLHQAVLTVGLAGNGGASELSADLSTAQYKPIQQVLTEMATLLYLESHLSTDGVVRFAVSRIAESSGGAVTRSYDFKSMTPRWEEMLAGFRVLPTF